MVNITFSKPKGDNFKEIFRNGHSMGRVAGNCNEEDLPKWLFEENLSFGDKKDGFDPGLPPWSYRAVYSGNKFLGYQSLDPKSGKPLTPYLWGNEKKN